jgi:hypothetical protein
MDALPDPAYWEGTKEESREDDQDEEEIGQEEIVPDSESGSS